MSKLGLVIFIILIIVNVFYLLISFIKMEVMFDRRKLKLFFCRFGIAIINLIEIIILVIKRNNTSINNLLYLFIIINFTLMLFFPFYLCYSYLYVELIKNIKYKTYIKEDIRRSKKNNKIDIEIKEDNYIISYFATYGNVKLGEAKIDAVLSSDIKDANHVRIKVYYGPYYVIKIKKDYIREIKLENEEVLKNIIFSKEDFINLIKEDIINKYGNKEFIIRYLLF